MYITGRLGPIDIALPSEMPRPGHHRAAGIQIPTAGGSRRRNYREFEADLFLSLSLSFTLALAVVICRSSVSARSRC